MVSVEISWYAKLMTTHDWHLAEHGDSFEREWARHVLDGFPAYEDFWRRHVVPLSFREHEPLNPFVRPSVPARLADLANAGYAVFYHVAHCHAYLDQLCLRKDYTAFPRPTECLYCFFSHARSGLDALLYLCRAVNNSLKEYDREAIFEVKTVSQWLNPVRLEYCTPRVKGAVNPDLGPYFELTAKLASYRNLLVHNKPIFLQNDWLPRPEFAAEYAGLTAIGKLAKNPAARDAHFVPARDELTDMLGLLKQFAQSLVKFSTVHLDALAETSYPRDQRKLGKGDHKLTLQDFKRARGV